MIMRLSVKKKVLVFIAILATTSTLIAHAGNKDKPAIINSQTTSVVASQTAEASQQEDELIVQLERAHDAARAGDMATAEKLFQQVRASAFPWHSWAATGGLIATHRMRGNFSAAFRETMQISTDKPRLSHLMSVWNGDTAVLAGDLAGAQTHYKQAASGSTPGVAALALNQLARLALLQGLPYEAAELKRELLRRATDPISAELLLAEAMVFDAMASDQLPIGPLSVLLHGDHCTAENPCTLQNGPPEAGNGEYRQLAEISGLRFAPSSSDLDLLEDARTTAKRPRAQWGDPLSSVCTASTASDGFRGPITHSRYGLGYMEAIERVYHPGVDIGSLSSNNGTYPRVFVAVARGCIRDANPSTWGSVSIEHYYLPDSWISQYGHANAIYYSAGAAISKGASLGEISTADYLHQELREADHPYRTQADYYSNLDLDTVGDWYENPLPFYESHRSYSFARWADEGAFRRYGIWSYVSGIGGHDDMRWASTTPSSSETNYALFDFIARSSGRHELWVFVPTNATSSRASYRIVKSSNRRPLLVGEVDQLSQKDTWVQIGSVHLIADLQYHVEVATNNGESDRRVGLDEILLIKP